MQPISFLKLDACSSLEELNEFVTNYAKENKFTPEQAEKVEAKVAGLYQKTLNEQKSTTVIYQETLSILFSLKRATEQILSKAEYSQRVRNHGRIVGFGSALVEAEDKIFFPLKPLARDAKIEAMICTA